MRCVCVCCWLIAHAVVSVFNLLWFYSGCVVLYSGCFRFVVGCVFAAGCAPVTCWCLVLVCGGAFWVCDDVACLVAWLSCERLFCWF